MGLQDSFSGIQRKTVFIIKPSKTEKCICFWTIHIIFFFSLFSTLRYKYCACSQICICTKQTESILKPMKYLLFLRHFNPINGKLYYLLWKQTWKKYLKHAVNYDTKWNIIFMLSLCSWNNFSFTNCESSTDWSLETDDERAGWHICHRGFLLQIINTKKKKSRFYSFTFPVLYFLNKISSSCFFDIYLCLEVICLRIIKDIKVSDKAREWRFHWTRTWTAVSYQGCISVGISEIFESQFLNGPF